MKTATTRILLFILLFPFVNNLLFALDEIQEIPKIIQEKVENIISTTNENDNQTVLENTWQVLLVDNTWAIVDNNTWIIIESQNIISEENIIKRNNIDEILNSIKNTNSSNIIKISSKNNIDINNPKKEFDWYIIKFKDKKIDLENVSSLNKVDNLININWLEIKDSILGENIVVIKKENEFVNEDKAIANLKNNPLVEEIEKNYYIEVESINSNDTNKDLLYWLENIWQNISTSWTWKIWADISFNKAVKIFSWYTNRIHTWVIVWIIDNWISYNHPDLINNMWDWTNCKDENWDFLGWCKYGYDFWSNLKDSYPKHNISSHWTHVAWIVAWTINNSNWIMWVNPYAKIMNLNVSDNEWNMSLYSIIKAIKFAQQNNAKVINMSLWWAWFSSMFYNSISDFTASWWIVIVAAWNDYLDTDQNANKVFPASFSIWNYVDWSWKLVDETSTWATYYPAINNLINVWATDNKDNLATYSNFWKNTVSITAPWTDIYSTVSTWVISMDWFSSWNTVFSWRKNEFLIQDWMVITSSRNPYLSGANSYIEKNIDLSNTYWTKLYFRVFCDAWKSWSGNNDYSVDYLWLSVSGNWFSWTYNYNYTSTDLPYLNSNNDWYYSSLLNINLEKYKSSDFKIRFDWNTDNIEDWNIGCIVYDIKIKWHDNWAWNSFEFYDGTSMASPYVAWLTSLVWSYKPNLTASDIKNSILLNWDTIETLSWKTLSWKRINAFKTLLSVTDSGSVEKIDAFRDITKSGSLLSSWDFIKNLSINLNWKANTNLWALEKYKLEVLDSSGSSLINEKYFSGEINDSFINLQAFSYTWETIKYKITPILYDLRQWLSKELELNYDNISPIFENVSIPNNFETLSGTIVLTWSVFDKNLSGSLLINNENVTLSGWLFTKTINLVNWNNNISLDIFDKAGNKTWTWINIIKNIPTPVSSPSSWWGSSWWRSWWSSSSSPSKDTCPDWDYSWSSYDKICWVNPNKTTSTWTNISTWILDKTSTWTNISTWVINIEKPNIVQKIVTETIILPISETIHIRTFDLWNSFKNSNKRIANIIKSKSLNMNISWYDVIYIKDSPNNKLFEKLTTRLVSQKYKDEKTIQLLIDKLNKRRIYSEVTKTKSMNTETKARAVGLYKQTIKDAIKIYNEQIIK